MIDDHVQSKWSTCLLASISLNCHSNNYLWLLASEFLLDWLFCYLEEILLTARYFWYLKLLILLHVIVEDLQSACCLWTERGELLKGFILVDFCHIQLLGFCDDLMIELILSVILRISCLGSQIKKFRGKIMKLFSWFHVRSLKLTFPDCHMIWIIINDLQMLNHLIGISVQIQRFSSQTRCDMFACLVITVTDHVDLLKLRISKWTWLAFSFWIISRSQSSNWGSLQSVNIERSGFLTDFCLIRLDSWHYYLQQFWESLL